MDSRRARKRGRPNTTWRRTAERERERAAENSSEVHITVADRGGWRIVLRPYVPRGMKTKGEGEGDGCLKSYSYFIEFTRTIVPPQMLKVFYNRAIKNILQSFLTSFCLQPLGPEQRCVPNV